MARGGMVAMATGMAAVVALLSGCAVSPSGGTVASSAPSSATGRPATSAASEPASTSRPGSAATPEGPCSYPASGDPAKPVDPPPTKDIETSGKITFTLQMTEGPVAITMDRAAAPCTVNSFSSLAQQGFYDGTTCHRLVDQGIYILQCGDPSGTGRGGPGYRYADELTGNETYPKGTVAMANAGPDTNGSQFFLVWADSQLGPDYTVFGTLDEASLEVVTSIASKGVSRDNSPAPISPAKIESVSVG